MEVDADPLGDDALKIDTPPAHDAVFLALRASLDDLRKLGCLLSRKPGLRVFRPVIEKHLRTQTVEAVNQSRNVWRSMPPILAHAPRSIPSRPLPTIEAVSSG